MSKKTFKIIFSNNFLLVSHYATYAMQDLLYEYLTNNKAAYVKKINFPLPELPLLKQVQIETNKRGEILQKYVLFSLIKPAPVAYLFHLFQLFFLILLDRKNYDVVIAENSILALVCLLLKKIRKVKKVIFYSHGFSNDRFSKSNLNKIYRWIDKTVALKSDFNWLLSNKMVLEREKQGVDMTKIFWVPTALQLSRMKRKNYSDENVLVFLGVLNEMNGVLLLPDILAAIKKSFPNYRLDIIGDGPLKEELLRKLRQKNLLTSVKFLGVQRFNDYKNTLTTYAIGLAPYKPSATNLLNSTDPMKIRLYMAAGLPIVTTKEFPFSKEIVENNLGFAVEYSSKAYSSACISLLKNKLSTKIMRKNNLLYSLQFDQETVFRKPLEALFYE